MNDNINKMILCVKKNDLISLKQEIRNFVSIYQEEFDYNTYTKDREKPILVFFAVEYKKLQIAKFLLPKSDLNTKNCNGDSVPLYAAKKGFFEIIEYCIGRANFNIQNAEKNTAPIFLVKEEQTKLVEKLVSTDCVNWNIQDNNGDTAIMLAIKSKNSALVDILKSKSDIDEIFDNDGNSPRDLAYVCGSPFSDIINGSYDSEEILSGENITVCLNGDNILNTCVSETIAV
ncbi:ankyrin repeat domain-containing protein [Rickettsia endosymbiont of Cardiosporidium cionae]|uniref:ankyrin repeat domain-containing protein n=1 Tax=Rickettsia endosymbiont of Cardiosporidium cionae TaxID=2777155 RepID=UPI001894F7A9|nr:ankyrin repeat domain-containing protein [Rickettsia endosymbiont of Cardiosporidium cionae]KAF8818094.1 hypothetical protein IHI24_000893 [Rickettsia endosymbiont of Cardiosporidium cionae]